MLFLKITGAVMLTSAGVLAGFLAARQLSKREKELNWFSAAVCEIGQKIRQNSGNIADIISKIQGSENHLAINRHPFNIKVVSDVLNYEEKREISDFFKRLGMGDIQSEYKKCLAYAEILGEKAKSARAETCEKSRLYKSIGLFCGLLIAVILI